MDWVVGLFLLLRAICFCFGAGELRVTLVAPEGAAYQERNQWFSESVNFTLAALLVECNEPGATCYA